LRTAKIVAERVAGDEIPTAASNQIHVLSKRLEDKGA
jgi:hypothetical protein